MSPDVSAAGTWDALGEAFDEKLPRRTAIAVKPRDGSLGFAYPAPWGCIGWRYDDRESSGYDEDAVLEWRLAPWLSAGVAGRPVAQTNFVWEKQEYRPDLVTRIAAFSDHGLVLAEQFGRAIDGAFTWRFSCGNRALQILERSVFLVFENRHGWPEWRTRDARTLTTEGFAVCGPFARWATYAHLEDAEADVLAGALRSGGAVARYLVVELPVRVAPYGSAEITFGLAFGGADAARAAAGVGALAPIVHARWNAWLAALPRPEFAHASQARAYAKCWSVVRLNYHDSPRYGHLVCEALPVYRGYWLWALDAVEWHSNQNPEHTSVHIRRALDLFFEHQREDGFITHAIYLDEAVPGERWARENITQTPHIAWVALRYAQCTGDDAALARWYPRLARFHEYLCATRDRALRNLHLWAVLTSFDCGLDTTAVLQRVTYGEGGPKEAFCYPAIFGAERCRYEQAMALIADRLGNREGDRWRAEAEQTRAALEAHLWDAEKKWFGARHADGSLDTRIGVDGLFPLAYGLVAEERATGARPAFEQLLGRYGVHTVAPDEPGFEARHYWRGPAWPKSCALGLFVAQRYFPDLSARVLDGLVRMLALRPSVWECVDAATGEVARGDQGLCATPLISSNVGAGAAIGALLAVGGIDMMALDGACALAPVENFHWGGVRFDLRRRGRAGWRLTVRAAEQARASLRFRGGPVLEVGAGEIRDF